MPRVKGLLLSQVAEMRRAGFSSAEIQAEDDRMARILSGRPGAAGTAAKKITKTRHIEDHKTVVDDDDDDDDDDVDDEEHDEEDDEEEEEEEERSSPRKRSSASNSAIAALTGEVLTASRALGLTGERASAFVRRALAESAAATRTEKPRATSQELVMTRADMRSPGANPKRPAGDRSTAPPRIELAGWSDTAPPLSRGTGRR